MTHQNITISMIISTILYLIIVVFYLIYTSLVRYNFIILFIKIIPVSLLIVQCFIYIKLYDYHNYVVGILLSLFFFACGDLFLGLREYYHDMLFFSIGLLVCSIARIIITFTLLINPYRTIPFWIYKFRIWHIFCFAIILATAPIYFIIVNAYVSEKINLRNINLWILLLYVMLCTISCCASYMRYGLVNESFVSVLLSMIGITIITISDTIIGINMFIRPILFQNIIIMSLYWIGCLLLMWSIVRNWH